MDEFYGYPCYAHISSGLSAEKSAGKEICLGGYKKNYDKIRVRRPEEVERLKNIAKGFFSYFF